MDANLTIDGYYFYKIMQMVLFKSLKQYKYLFKVFECLIQAICDVQGNMYKSVNFLKYHKITYGLVARLPHQVACEVKNLFRFKHDKWCWC